MSAGAFAFRIDTPAAFPWRQARIARLEAQHRSPVKSSAGRILLARRKPWRAGCAGDFYAAVLRNDTLPEGRFLELEVDGEAVRFALSGETPPLGRVVALALILASTGVLTWSGWKAYHPQAPAPVAAPRPSPAMREPPSSVLAADLVRVRDAFAGREIRSMEWTPGQILVETGPGPTTEPLGAGFRVTRVGEAEGGGVRWRLTQSEPAS